MRRLISFIFQLYLVVIVKIGWSAGSDKPNIVLIIGDDMSWNDFGCYGSKVVKTPHIDRLAREGMRFTHTFLTASSCSPSRCSIISGKYPHSNGAAELHTPLPENEIPFPLLLRQNNYYTMHAGKWHMGPAAHRAFNLFTDENGYNNGNGGEANWVRFLQERPKDKPFFCWFASTDAHRPWGADNFKVTHNPEEVDVPVYFADTPETRGDLASYYNEIARFDFFIGEVRRELERQGVLENTLIIVMADNGRPFPRDKTRVYDSGMKTPFVVFWPGGIRQKGKVSESLISAVDIGPTLLELAGVAIPEAYQGKSFTPVFKKPGSEIRQAIFAEHNWHDYEAHERMVRTKSFMYVLNSRPNLSNGGPADSKRSPTQHALNKLRDEGMLTQAQTDIFVTPRPREELFDLRKDPLQLVNCASLPEHKETLDQMRQMLKNWQDQTGDTVPEELTPDWHDRETGEGLKMEKKRGTMPGMLKMMYYTDSSRLGQHFAKDPHVVAFQDRYLMYYSVKPYTDEHDVSHGLGIGIAESSDLIQWTRIGDVNTDSSAVYESKGVGAPCALVIGDKVHLFYQTYGNREKDAICHAWSADGIHFTRNETNPIFHPDGEWNCGRAIDVEVVKFKGNYYLYFATRTPDFKIQLLGVAMAPGTTNFNREDWTHMSVGGSILKPELPWEKNCIEAPSVIEKNGRLYMFYAGAYNNEPQQVGLAVSTDGINWERVSEDPFLKNGNPGEWNSSESGHPHIFEDPEGDTRLFFQGNNDHGKTWYLSNIPVKWGADGPTRENQVR